ncbi:MAG: thioredoxin family protein [Clostridia bacterium]|nr:thioredoxin family protein [Clostridia bacterium]
MKKGIKILVVAVILVGVATVWMIKNKSVTVADEVEKNSSLSEEKRREELEKEDASQANDASEPLPVIQEETQAEVPETIEKPELVKEKGPSEIEKAEEKTVIPENSPEEKEEVPEEQKTIEEALSAEKENPEAVVTPELAATEFDLEKLKSYKLPIMIEFGASWCTWCRWMEPTLEELNKEYAGKVIIQSVDVEKFRSEVSSFDVSLLPTIYFFDAEGTVFETRVGAMVKEDILKVFESMGVKND